MATMSRTTLQVSENVFKGKAFEGKKTRGDILYERNTARKQLAMKTEQVKKEKDAHKECREKMLDMLLKTLRETKDKETAKRMVWEYYGMYPQGMRVFTKHTTGEKTRRAEDVEIRTKAGVERVVAHLTADGEYYKRWDEGDEPAFYMKMTPITPDNFTLTDAGVMEPIRKY